MRTAGGAAAAAAGGGREPPWTRVSRGPVGLGKCWLLGAAVAAAAPAAAAAGITWLALRGLASAAAGLW